MVRKETEEVFGLKPEETQGPKLAFVSPEKASHVDSIDQDFSFKSEQSMSFVSIGYMFCQDKSLPELISEERQQAQKLL